MSLVSNQNRGRFLITTADERTWRFDRPVLFLGEWCRLYDRRSAWENLDSAVVPYHWNDRKQLYLDYLRLQNLKEELLTELSDSLNKFHGVDRSKRYWRILLGPWLGSFVELLFDRWTMIQLAVSNFDIKGSIVLDLPAELTIPNDMDSYNRLCLTDLWNHAIYGEIISRWTSVKCENVSFQDRQKGILDLEKTEIPKRRLMARLRSTFVRKVFSNNFLSRPTDAFFLRTFVPNRQNVFMQLQLGQVPKLWESPQAPQTIPNLSDRRHLRLMNANHETFDNCVRSLIPEQIPTLYLEGYHKLQDDAYKLPWPERPRVIFTSASYNSDDMFKAYAAAKVESGSKLVIGQHGGRYGACSWSSDLDHQVAIADRFLTWGWANNNPKHYPALALKLFGLYPRQDKSDGFLLLINVLFPRYTYYIYSGPFSSQTCAYFNHHFAFVDALPDHIRSQLLVRLFPWDYGWAQISRWRDRHPDVRLDDGAGPFWPLVEQSRICVSTTNDTVFLETLGKNIPTVIFWNPTIEELLPSAVPYFDQLKQVGIFHQDSQSAAIKIGEVWDDVLGWWKQPEIQEARRHFCHRFARMPDEPIEILAQALTTFGNSKNVLHDYCFQKSEKGRKISILGDAHHEDPKYNCEE